LSPVEHVYPSVSVLIIRDVSLLISTGDKLNSELVYFNDFKFRLLCGSSGYVKFKLVVFINAKFIFYKLTINATCV